MIFWGLVILMVLMALVLVLGPFYRRAGKMPARHDQIEKALVQVRLAELENDLRNKTVTLEQAQYIRRELELELSRTASNEEASDGSKSLLPQVQKRWGTALVVAVILPLSATGLYLWLGAPELADTSRFQASHYSAEEVEAMIRRIESYLQNHPDDAEGWLVLSHYYLATGMEKEAAEALKQLSRLAKAGSPEEDIDAQLPQVAPDASMAGMQESVGRDEESGRIRANVSLSPAFLNTVAPGDTLFIYAQEADGQPMPVAVVRRTARDLPMQVVLNDAVSIRPDRKLSALERVDLTARISKSGDASPRSGDLIGRLNDVAVGQEQPLELVIDQTVP